LRKKEPHPGKKISPAKKVPVKSERNSFSGIIANRKYTFIIISILTLITYSGSFNNNLVFFDDNTMMDNISILKKTEMNMIKDSFRLDAMAGTKGMFYRPFQTFILITLSFIGGYKSYIFFLMMVHIINANLLFHLLSLFKFDSKKSFISAMIYSVHPLFTPIINWIPSIGDASVTLFILISFISLIKYFEHLKPWFLILHIGSFFFAMLSKEIAIFFPLICVLYLFLFKGFGSIRERFKDMIILALSWITVVGVYLYLRNTNMQSSETDIAQIGISTLIFNIPVLFQFVLKFFIPVQLSLVSMNSWIRLFGGLVISIIIIYLAFKQGKRNLVIFSAIWLALFLMPTLVFQHPNYDYLEHRGYLPLISIAFLLPSFKWTKYDDTVLILVIPLFCMLSFNRANNFSDPIRFYKSIIKNEKIPMAYNNLAIEQDNVQDFQSALIGFDQAIELEPSYVDAYINRGNLKAQRFNDFGGAVADYQLAIQLIKKDKTLKKDLAEYADIYNNMGTAKHRLNDPKGALIDYARAIEIKPDYAKAFYNRGILKAESLLDHEGALMDLNKAIEIEPEYYEAYINRGVIREINFHDLEGALSDYNKAISIKPGLALAYYNRGMFYKGINKNSTACRDWQTAANLGHVGAIQMLNSFCK
jgi:tetratricopeptide (TPR) repeat protein